jgi:hypothetical protein
MAVKAGAGWVRNKLAATPAAARRVKRLGLIIFKSSDRPGGNWMTFQ